MSQSTWTISRKEPAVGNYRKDSPDVVMVLDALFNAGLGQAKVSGGRIGPVKCPFPDHHEKTGSFYVYKDSNWFECFGACGRSGSGYHAIAYYLNPGAHELNMRDSNIWGATLKFAQEQNWAEIETDERNSRKSEKTVWKPEPFTDEFKAWPYLRKWQENIWKVHQQITEQHGITLRSIERFGLGFVGDDTPDAPEGEDWRWFRSRIAIPWISNGALRGIHLRALERKDKSYPWWPGSHPTIFNADVLMGRDKSALAIVEDEKSTMRLFDFGVTAIGLHAGQGKNGGLRDEWLSGIRPFKRKVIIGDKDEAGLATSRARQQAIPGAVHEPVPDVDGIWIKSFDDFANKADTDTVRAWLREVGLV
jgi:hypothetical protein